MEQNENKKNSIFIPTLIAVLMLIIGVLCGYILSDKMSTTQKTNNNEYTEKNNENANKNEDNEKDNTSTDASSSTDNANVQTPQPTTCQGRYYGEYVATGYNLRYTYVLNSDGTYSADFSGVNATSGTYTINGTSITFSHYPEISGPTPQLETETYIISTDCSKITITGNHPFDLIRQ